GQPAWLPGIPLAGAPAWLRHATRPWLVLPIHAGEASPRCLLALSWDDPGFDLPPEELRVLEGLAGQIGVALAREDRAAVAGAARGRRGQGGARPRSAKRART